MKICKNCNVAKPKTSFYVKRVSKDGRAPWCKDCEKASDAALKNLPLVEGFKRCRRCRKEKSLRAFGVRVRNKDGRHWTCLACTNAYHQKRCFAPSGIKEKRCAMCGVSFPISHFHVNKRSCDGFGSYCRKCRRAYMHKNLYGLTPQTVQTLILRQHNSCAICKKPFNEGKKSTFHIDHDHATAKVRGILCYGCNTGLGAFADSPMLLREAAAYLEV